MHGSQAQRIWRSPRSSRWRWSSDIAAPQRSQRAVAGAPATAVVGCPRAKRRKRATTSALSAPGGGSLRPTGSPLPAAPCPVRVRTGAAPAPPSRPCPPARAAAPARAGPPPRPARARRAAGRSRARSARRSGSRRSASRRRGRHGTRHRRCDRPAACPSTLATTSSAPRSVIVRSSPGETSPAASSAIHVGVGAGRSPLGIWICSSPGDGPGGLRAGTTPSTSSPARSGAASSIASLMASSSVAADAGQPLQWPSRRSRATPSSMPRNSTSPPWDSM